MGYLLMNKYEWYIFIRLLYLSVYKESIFFCGILEGLIRFCIVEMCSIEIKKRKSVINEECLINSV